MHKPRGVLTTLADPNDRRCVAALLPQDWRGRVGVVGRLDKPTTGALLVTDDGDLNNLLTAPASHVWKRYILTVVGEPDELDPRLERLRQGVAISGVRTKPARCGVVAGTGRADGGDGRLSEVWIEIAEGRFHQVRRMANQVQLKFVHLHRAAIGPLELGALAPGEWRSLRADEVDDLYTAAGGRDAPIVGARTALRRHLDAGELDPIDAALVRRYFDGLVSGIDT
ncbi:MAG: rRNA pseudouridine synthase [Deltaproteobacteria bacterium]|nr:rRNA pseudouridine synthase [Deltaproteobacteria bacterium]